MHIQPFQIKLIGKIFLAVSQTKQIETVTGYSISYTYHDTLHTERLEYGNFSALTE